MLRIMRFELVFSCPNHECHLRHEWPACVDGSSDDLGGRFPLFVCPYCKQFIELRASSGYGGYGGCSHDSFTFQTRLIRDYATYAPLAVRDALEEALKCHRAGAWTGCVALARKAVEIIATEIGGRGKSLYQRLEDIKDRALVAEVFVHMDHYVRNLGNLAVHYNADKPTKCDRAEADCALAYAYEVSKRIFLHRKVEELGSLERSTYLEYVEDPQWFHWYGIEGVESPHPERPKRRKTAL
jgi:hypothetical protein